MKKSRIERISELLKEFVDYRYDNNNYVYIFNSSGVLLSYPLKKFIGKNIKDFSEQDKQVFAMEFMSIIKGKGEGFLSYIYNYSKEKNDNVKRHKISYIKFFKEEDLVICSGFFEDDINKIILTKQQSINKIYYR